MRVSACRTCHKVNFSMKLLVYLNCFQNSLSETETHKSEMEKNLQQQINTLKEQLNKLSTDKQTTEAKLTGDLDALHKRLLGEELKITMFTLNIGTLTFYQGLGRTVNNIERSCSKPLCFIIILAIKYDYTNFLIYLS